MKVVTLIKQKRDELAAQYQFQLKDWLSPTLRDYWGEFLQRANQVQLLVGWNRDQQQPLADEPAVPAVAVRVEPEPQEIELLPAARELYDELLANLGEEIHVGEWLEVSQDRINRFAEVTEDHQWIHTDPARAAAESPFKTTIAHGFLTLALLPVLTDSVSPETPRYPTAKLAVNYGLNQVRFPYPVKAGSRVRARTRLASVVPIKRGLELINEITVEVEGSRRPACVAESVVRLYF